MTAFYNEIDPYCAEWLRNLIAAGEIAPGVVDKRPIQEIEAWELAGYRQCHFFAGIGVWSRALRDAGWPDDVEIWTGSCPCQPFSAAGKQKGFDDDRHLWPYWYKLIDEFRPAIVVGEQVASALAWLDLVSTDLEATGYAFGAADLCAAGFDGAHIRQRLYFAGLADADALRREGSSGSGEAQEQRATERSGASGLADADGRQSGQAGAVQSCGEYGQQPQDDCAGGGLADAGRKGRGEVGTHTGRSGKGSGAQGLDERSGDSGAERRPHAPMLGRNAVDWLFCRDGKWRPVGPGTFPLANAAPSRVGRLRAYGNALDLETATQFASAVREIAGV